MARAISLPGDPSSKDYPKIRASLVERRAPSPVPEQSIGIRAHKNWVPHTSAFFADLWALQKNQPL
jgi:hypothetical protein